MDSSESNIFIDKNDLLKKFDCRNLNSFEVESYNDIDITLSMSLDSFLMFAQSRQLDVFYHLIT